MKSHLELLTEISATIERYVGDLNESGFIPGVDPLRIAEPSFDHEEILAVVDSLLDKWLGANWRAQRLEEALGNHIGVSGAKLTTSGSCANLLAVSTLVEYAGLAPGDEIITTALSFPTTINALLHKGLAPVLLDSIPGSYVIDVETLEESLGPRVKGILVTHTLGNPANMKLVVDFANKHGLFLIEDACDALGATYGGKKVGSLGDLGTFSFYPAHHITTGEGGAITFRNGAMESILTSGQLHHKH
ncbi:MAG: DegT/DnrJ/EryC1/StrS family aminotransferase [Nitrososphaera sp.]